MDSWIPEKKMDWKRYLPPASNMASFWVSTCYISGSISTQKNTIFSSLEVAENVGNNLHVDHQGADKGCLNVRIVKYPYHPLSQLLTFKTFGDNKAVSLSFG